MTLKRGQRISIVLLLTLLLFGLLGIYTLLSLDPAAVRESLAPPVETPAPTPEPTPAPAATPAPTPKPTPSPEPTPVKRKRTELLVLVNPWHEMEEGYVPELQQVTWGYEEEQFMDVRAAEALMQMVADCAAAGNDPFICSSYRSMEKQQYLYNNKIYRLVYEEGVPEADAPAIAARSVAVPGTSEHQLGLAADIIDYNFPYLNEEQELQPTQQWLMENCWHYGFILRYPNDKSDITGIIYEPWHYRYVGVEAAEEIHALGLTLEEYLEEFYE